MVKRRVSPCKRAPGLMSKKSSPAISVLKLCISVRCTGTSLDFTSRLQCPQNDLSRMNDAGREKSPVAQLSLLEREDMVHTHSLPISMHSAPHY